MLFCSFIIPVYNVDKYLKQCVDSVLGQSFQDYEIILVNDGSVDKSGKICDMYAEKEDRVKVIHIENSGPSIARNKGIELARGEYLIFLDADDYWINDVLATIEEKCIKTNVDLLVFNYDIYNDNKNIIDKRKAIDFSGINNNVYSGEEYLTKVMNINMHYGWYSWFYVIKRNIFDQIKLNYKEGILYEDVDLMYRIILTSEKVLVYDKIILRYRIKRQGAITNDTKLDTEINKLQVVKNNLINIKEMNINYALKKKLCNNFTCIAYSTLILFYEIKSKNEREKLLIELNDSLWVFENVISFSHRITLLSIKLLGISITCKILHFRRQMKIYWGV